MKKRVLSVLFIVLLFSLLLVGCGSKKKTDIDNTSWVLASAESLGIELSAEEIGMGEFVIEFKTDGKVTVTADGDTSEGTFKVDGDEVTISEGGETMVFTKDGNVLSIDQDGAVLNFEKK
ncbi:hypothetical protein GCM10023142_27590 [Anaerocolumna aminovalerica]|uniref:Uncharacterized protein n=2 Tax=Anaerocolumna aminovalerica TaxID=1527 RepID=A0A1I5HQ42_9FIRM|nr:hypothetical protein [Anaerocolumna aminovalerica]SFO49951.1 hypothetical protein SAMN04489757_13220 [Anaerocolumna aminovalerica]